MSPFFQRTQWTAVRLDTYENRWNVQRLHSRRTLGTAVQGVFVLRMFSAFAQCKIRSSFEGMNSFAVGILDSRGLGFGSIR